MGETIRAPETFEIDSAPSGVEFLAEDRNGDWVKVERYDNPFGFKNTVINNRTGKWWSPERWMPTPTSQP